MDDFQEIYNMYFMDVYKYVLSLCREAQLAEEITQETFFKAMKNLDGFRGQCRLFVWLCQIAKNTYFSHQGKSSTSFDAEPEASQSVEEAILQKETAFEIHRILHHLPEPYKGKFVKTILMAGRTPDLITDLILSRTRTPMQGIQNAASNHASGYIQKGISL